MIRQRKCRKGNWMVWVGGGLSIYLACSLGRAAQPETADMALIGGRIISVDPQERIVEAVAIKDGRFLAVGSDQEIRRRVGPDTHVMQLEGRTVIPGIIQTHSHAMGAAQQSLRQQHVELRSISAVQRWIRQRASELPEGRWIEVPRSDITRLAERRHPTTAKLDAAGSSHPVAFKAAQKWALNSVGLRASGILDEARKDSAIRVVLDDRNRPRLFAGADSLLQPLIRSSQPAVEAGSPEHLDALVGLHAIYNEMGITSIFERATDRSGYDIYQTLRQRDRLTVRATLTLRSQMRSAADVERFVTGLQLDPTDRDPWVKPGPLKITVDGGIHWGNTYLREPYGPRRMKFYGLSSPDYRGDIRFSVEQMADVFSAAHRLGWQMCCHVTGDAGVDRVLDALEVADRQVPVGSRRFTLVHAYFPESQAIARGGQLGVCVDSQVDLYYKDSEAIAEVYGEPWAARFIGVGDWLRGGIPVAINGDHMMGYDPDTAMNSFNPFLHMYIAVTRKNEAGQVYGAHQKISRMEALRAMTSTAARLSFDEQRLGMIRPEMLADLVVLDRDLLRCPESQIKDIAPLMTVVDGKVVFARPPFSNASNTAR